MSKSASVGREVARRRKQLIWTQGQLADAAGVGLTTVVQIEKDRSVRENLRRLVLDALEREEEKRGLTGSVIAPSTTEAPKEGADGATKLRQIDDRTLERLEVFLSASLEAVRRARADIADDSPQVSRRRG